MKTDNTFFVACVAGLSLALLPLLSGGCDKSGIGDGRLPAVSTHGSCVEHYPAPSGCEWALSLDAIVWGTLARIRPITLPAVVPDTGGNWVWVDSCDGAINIALELEIAVERGPVTRPPRLRKAAGTQRRQFRA